jgi:NADH:ubiquinone oxidoreductase subunit F (NADH-binding)
VAEVTGKCDGEHAFGKRTPEATRQARERYYLGYRAQSLPQLERLFDVMAHGSLCAFGQLLPGPMSQMLQYFGERIFQ